MSLLRRLEVFPVNDVSTDVDAPPALDGQDGTPGGGPDMTAARRDKARRAYPELMGGLLLKLAPAAAFALVEACARRQVGWTIQRVEPSAGLLTAVAVTPLMRFRDDVTIRTRPEAGGCRVDMRSRSRKGKDDLGANAARIRRFFRDVRAAQP